MLAESRGKRKVKLTKEFHDDLVWWTNLAFSFNSVPMVDLANNRSWISVATGTLPVTTEGPSFSTEILWPCVYIAGQDFEMCTIVNEADDYYIGCAEGETNGITDIFVPNNLAHDPVACEIISVWSYLFRTDLYNCIVDIFVIRKQTFLCFKKSRVKDSLLMMLLRQIFWWSMERNVKLSFIYAPLS